MKSRLSFYALVVLLVAACGGGGGGGGGESDGGGGGGITYSGATAAVAIDNGNAEAIAVGAVEGVEKAMDAESASGAGIPFSVMIIADDSADGLMDRILNETWNILAGISAGVLPQGVVLDGSFFPAGSGYCGGTITAPDSWLQTDGSGYGTVVYNDFCLDMGDVFGGQVRVNGSVTISATSDGGKSTTYNNLTLTFNGQTYVLNGTELCDAMGSCTIAMDYRGADGKIHRMSDVNYLDNYAYGNLDANYCHPDLGCVAVEARNLQLCGNGGLTYGYIRVTGSNGANISVDFRTDCSGFDATYSGIDGSTATFSVDW